MVMGNLFNDIVIHRTKADGSLGAVITVPLTYAAKDKMIARIKEDPNLDKETAITVPRMSFKMGPMSYDGSRHLNPIGKTVVRHSTNVNRLKTQYNPVPYNFEFELYIFVKYAEDANKILEQILPFFTPEWNCTINMLPEINEVRDIPIVLNSVTEEENSFDGSLESRRIIIYTLSFTLKGYVYGPVLGKPIIKFVDTNYFIGNKEENTANDVVEVVQVTPGLLANGNPTSNSEASISPLLIDIEDDWGYCFTETKGITIEFE